MTVCALFAGVLPVVAWSIVVRQLLPEVRAAERSLRALFPPAPMTTDPFR